MTNATVSVFSNPFHEEFKDFMFGEIEAKRIGGEDHFNVFNVKSPELCAGQLRRHWIKGRKERKGKDKKEEEREGRNKRGGGKEGKERNQLKRKKTGNFTINNRQLRYRNVDLNRI